MTNLNKNLEKFPTYFQNKIRSGELVFPESVRFEYDSFNAFRAVEREKEDFAKVTICDFKSHAERGIKPRGRKNDEETIGEYAASLFKELRELANIMKLPRPKKKVVEGPVHMKGGPIDMNYKNSHVNWWLYEGADVSNFTIIEYPRQNEERYEKN